MSKRLKIIEIKVFHTIFAFGWKDPDPDPEAQKRRDTDPQHLFFSAYQKHWIGYSENQNRF